MIGKIISQLLGGGAGGCQDGGDRLLEFEEGDWVIVQLPEAGRRWEEPKPLPSERPRAPTYQTEYEMGPARRRNRQEEASRHEDQDKVSSRPIGSSSPRCPRGPPPTAARSKTLSRGALFRQNQTGVKRRQRRPKQPAPRPFNY